MDLSFPHDAVQGDGTINWDVIGQDSRFMESRIDLRELVTLAQHGQLNEELMRDLSDDQLVFLAPFDPATAGFELTLRELEATIEEFPSGFAHDTAKARRWDLVMQRELLEQNARRARLELDRRRDERDAAYALDLVRRTNRVALLGASVAVVGTLAGAVVGALL